MKIMKAIALLAGIAATHGNVRVFMGDCTPIKKLHFSVYEPITECPTEKKKLGKLYLHIGEH